VIHAGRHSVPEADTKKCVLPEEFICRMAALRPY
jgi:hypothetical protein